MNRKVQRFISSLDQDYRLAPHEARAGLAHLDLLVRKGAVSPAEAKRIRSGLREVLREILRNPVFSDAEEDIHTAMEARLHRKIGPAAGRLHTGRSRNDLVATEMRMALREATEKIRRRLARLCNALSRQARRHRNTAMPGFTHLQHAQPVSLAWHLDAYVRMFRRDSARFGDALSRTEECPLGAAALAGTPWLTPAERKTLARKLGFRRISANPMDAVSDRDFLLEFLAAAAICATHLSRLAEEIILWSSPEFNFIRLDPAFCSGSSIMPQKQNPDAAELIRGRSGRLIADLVGLLTVMKALPLAYNRDMQEDKVHFFRSAETLERCLETAEGMVATMKPDRARMRRACEEGFLLATEAADYLAERGVPFRKAHAIVGRIVEYSRRAGKRLTDLSLSDWRRFHPAFGPEVLSRVRVEEALRRRQRHFSL